DRRPVIRAPEGPRGQSRFCLSAFIAAIAPLPAGDIFSPSLARKSLICPDSGKKTEIFGRKWKPRSEAFGRFLKETETQGRRPSARCAARRCERTFSGRSALSVYPFASALRSK